MIECQNSINLILDRTGVNQAAMLSYQIDAGRSIASGDCIKFDVQNPYSTNPEYYEPFSGSTCTSSSGHQVSCSVVSSTQLKMTFNSASTTQTIIGDITSLRNPYSKVTLTVTVGYYIGCDSAIAAENPQSQQFITFSSGTINSISMSSNSDVIGKQSCTLTLRFSPVTILKPSGRIEFFVPFWYTTSNSNSNIFYMLDRTSVVASSTSGFTVSNSAFSASSGIYSFNFATSGSDISSGTQITLTFTNFRNPITSSSVTGFQLFTLDVDGNIIDQTVTSQTFPGVSTPASISSTSASLLITTSSVANYQVAQTGRTLSLSFTVNAPLEKTCYVKITFPSQIKIDVDETLTGFKGTGFMTGDGSFSSGTSTKSSYGTGTNQVIVASCTDQNQLGKSQQEGTIQLYRLVSPTQVMSVSSFSISVAKDQSFTNVIATGTITPSFTMVANSISINSFTALSKIVQLDSSYTFTFTPTSNLFSDSFFEITLPENMELSTTTCIVASTTNLLSSATCSFSGTTMKVSNALSDTSTYGWDYTINGAISITITGPTNPYASTSFGSWSVKSYNLVSGIQRLVDQSTTVSTGVTAEKNTFSSVTSTITTASAIVYQESDMTFEFILSKNLRSGSKIKVIPPTDVKISSNSPTCKTKTSALGTNTASSCSKSTSTSTQNDNYILYTLGSSNVGTKDNTYSLIVSGFRNPRSLKQSQAFTIITMDNSNNIIEQGTGLFVQATKEGTTPTLSLTLQNYTNGNKTNGNYQNAYTFKFSSTSSSPFVPFENGDVVNIEFPSDITIGTPLTCSNSVKCIASGQILSVTVDKLSSTSYSYSTDIKGPINPPSMTETSQFNVQTFLDQNKITALDSNNKVKVLTKLPANILKYSLVQNTTELNQSAIYTIKFTPTNRLSTSSSIKLKWPTQVTIASTVSTIITTSRTFNDKGVVDVNSRTITWTGVIPTSTSNELTIELSPVINPKTSLNLAGFLINTYDDASQTSQIDVINDYILVPQFACSYPCKTCSKDSKSDCYSCWADGTLTYLYRYTSTGQCINQCPSGFTSNGDKALKQCVQCDSSCQNCKDNGLVNDKYRCIVCASGYNLQDSEGRCYKDVCPEGYYKSNSKTCSKCLSSCKTCDSTGIKCTSCFTNSTLPYLNDGVCDSACTPLVYVLEGYECVECQDPCLTCNITRATCLTCDITSTFPYFYSYTCLSACPEGTTADQATKFCRGCKTGCLKCDLVDQALCYECGEDLYLVNGKCLENCPDGWRPNFFRTACIIDIQEGVIYVPFSIAFVFMLLLSVIAYVKDKKTLIVPVMIALGGAVEFLSFLAALALTLLYSTLPFAVSSGAGVAIYILLNIGFTLYVTLDLSKNDKSFARWVKTHKILYFLILAFSSVFSFKIFRLIYSHLFGNDSFKASFTKPEKFKFAVIIFTSISLLSNGCMVFYGVSGLKFYDIQLTQLTIGMIDVMFISLAIIILEIIEMIQIKDYLKDPMKYQEVKQDSVMNFSEMDDTGYDLRMRQEMLKTIMNKVKRNQDIFLNNKLDDLFDKFGHRRCNSAQYERYRDGDPRLTKSEPSSPALQEGNFDRDAMMLERQDNVYAEAQPPNPLGNQGKTFNDADTQVKSSDISKILARKGGDFVNFEDSESTRRKDKKNKKRGRKNQYYTQIDAEDDEEVLNNNDNYDEEDDLDVIKEEDEMDAMREKAERQKRREEEERLRKEAEELEQQKIIKEQEERAQREKEEQERLQLEQQQKILEDQRLKNELEKQQKLEEERLVKEQEELEKARIEEMKLFEVQSAGQGEQAMLSNRQNFAAIVPELIIHEAVDETISESDKAGLYKNVLIEDSLNDFGKHPVINEGEVQAPPDAQNRNFNENDILGDFDRDEKGNVMVLQDENGNYVDKQGRPVNERGYLIKQETGDIIENQNNKKMFDFKDMDERGEIPAPFCLEKYNFNPFNMKGSLDHDKSGKLLVQQNKNKELQDKNGKKVNKNGWLTDAKGNIIDQFGRKKFDKKQLANDELPKLFNYNGRRFDINDVCGVFDRDQNGALLTRRNKQGQLIDNIGRLVNEKGYLVDQNDNIINKDGKKIFDKKHLRNGDFPKIFPFTKFKVKNIMGNFEMDPLGNPILDKKNGEYIDRDGKRVNQRGYYINGNGDVIDKYGKVMFDKEILDEEGEIPKVFRTGLLKSDTASSLSRLMSEIERNQPFEGNDSDHQRIQKELQKYKKGGDIDQQITGRRGSAGTSLDSMMGDTPSNYNVANQRFDQQQKLRDAARRQKNQPKIDEENDSQYDMDGTESQIKRNIQRRKKRNVVYKDPSEKDLLMAKAYGGVARGPVKRSNGKNSNRMMTADQSQYDGTRNLQKLVGSISGYQKDINSQSRDRLEEMKQQFIGTGPQHNISILNETYDPSVVAVPEHHIREQRLKQRKMNELKKKNKVAQKKKVGLSGDPDFEKMFGKDIDEFLEDSDWDIESFGKMSNFSKGTSKSAWGDGRIRGLESIYLQRIETSMKKGGRGKKTTVKPSFRVMQDRFMDEAELDNNPRNDRTSGVSQTRNRDLNNNRFMESANTTAMARHIGEGNLFSKVKKPSNNTQYREGREFTANRFNN